MLPGIFLILIVFPFWRMLTVTYVDGHDFLHYFYRIYALESMVKQGIWLPRILPDAAYGYGSPVFSFMWGLPLYNGVFLHLAGLPYPIVFKLLLLIPNVLSGIAFFGWMRSKVGKIAAAVASILYIWTPYRFLDTFIRYSIGELYFFALLPCLLYFLDRAQSKKSIFLGGISAAAMIYSHQGLSFIAYPICLGYCFIGYKTTKKRGIFIRQIILLGNGLLLSSFFWIPVLFYVRLLDIHPDQIEAKWFPPLVSLVRSKWEGGSVFNGQTLIMSFQIGLVQLGILLLAQIAIIYSFVRRKAINLFLFYWLGIFWIGLFFLQPISSWFWMNVPLLAHLQFPFRLLFIPMLTAAICCGYLLRAVSSFSQYAIGILLIVAVMIANRNHLGVLNKSITIPEIARYEGTYFVGGEMQAYDDDFKKIEAEEIAKLPRQEFQILQGTGKITGEKRELYKSAVTIVMDTPGEIAIRRLNFPGWNITRNDMPVESVNRSVLRVSLPVGTSEIIAAYSDPVFVKLATFITIATFFVNIWLILKKSVRPELKL